MSAPRSWVRWFRDVGMEDVGLVGGKNASLGEMIRELSPLGIRVPGGFALTAAALAVHCMLAKPPRPRISP